MRTAQVVKRKLNMLVVDCPLDDLAVLLEETSPDRFGFSYHSTDRPLKGITLYWTFDSHKQTELPACAITTRFVCKPNIQLCTRQRQRPSIKRHRTGSR